MYLGIVNVAFWLVGFGFLVQAKETPDIINYGALGAMVALLVAYIYWLQKAHKQERDVWKDTLEKQNNAMITAFKENISVMTELRTILQSIDRRIK